MPHRPERGSLATRRRTVLARLLLQRGLACTPDEELLAILTRCDCTATAQTLAADLAYLDLWRTPSTTT